MSKAFDETHCHSCGKPIKKEAEICIACGVKNKQAKKSYNRLVASLYCIFFGLLGAHRFYVGKTGTGIAFLCITLFSLLLTIFTIGLGSIITVPVLAILEIIVFIDFIRILIKKL
ncbi:TM2 domain-containing protein (plasmid) [Borreliella yangtzensis]|uniref:TM2 domain-containing protein n=1 Tax=Borreliella yangtzensis TaxID=683292 RepID=UPI003BA09B48